MAKSDEAKSLAETVSSLVARHGLATILALTLVGQLIYTNNQNTEKLESINQSQTEIAKSLTQISQSQAETAKVLERLTIKLESRR